MKTTIELLNNEIECISLQLFDGFLTFNEFMEQREALFEKAKEMEKQQMKDSYKQGFAYRDTWNWELDVDWDEDSTQENNQEFEQYYNETFKSE